MLLEERRFRALLLLGGGMARALHWEMPCTEESKLGRELPWAGAATLQCWAPGQGCASSSGSPFALSLPGAAGGRLVPAGCTDGCCSEKFAAREEHWQEREF